MKNCQATSRHLEVNIVIKVLDRSKRKILNGPPDTRSGKHENRIPGLFKMKIRKVTLQEKVCKLVVPQWEYA